MARGVWFGRLWPVFGGVEGCGSVWLAVVGLVSVVWDVWGWGGADCSGLAGLLGVGQQSWGRPRRLVRVVW